MAVIFIFKSMTNKCCVKDCKTGFKNGPKGSVFNFPKDKYLRSKWIKFVNRKDFTISSKTKLCIFHFEEKFIKQNDNRPRLIWKFHPIPSIYPKTIQDSLKSQPNPPWKEPKIRNVCPDQLSKFTEKDKVSSIQEVYSKVKLSAVFNEFEVKHQNDSLFIFRISYDDNIPVVHESITVKIS